MGKTAFVLSMAKNIAVDYRNPVALFSLEMSNVQLVNRLIANVCEIPSEKIKSGQLANYEWQQLDYKLKNLMDAPLTWMIRRLCLCLNFEPKRVVWYANMGCESSSLTTFS